MKYVFIEYPKCSTCQKAKKWLEEHKIDFESRNIVTENLTKLEIQKWKHNLELKKLFNTSGMLYREMSLKEKLDQMSEEEKINLLASNGMLVKRPIIVGDGVLLVGFKEKEWKEKLID